MNQTTAADRDGLDLSTCEQEPIRIPGSIQPHGMLLALSDPDLTVMQASENAAAYFDRDLESVLGSNILDLIGPENAELETSLLSSQERLPLYVATIPLGPRRALHHAIAHRHAGGLILEFERAGSGRSPTFRDVHPSLRSSLALFQDAKTVQELSQSAAAEVRKLTGFGRVLVYQFDANWHGHVIAEEKDPSYASYLGLWFPSSDIPQQARELYRLNRLRLIVDASYTPVKIHPAVNPVTGQPLDLSYATLRSVSPVHLEYLKNMGVGASMSISVLDGEKLWGLIACHHNEPRAIPFETRIACEFLSQTFSTKLAALERSTDYEHRIRLKFVMTKLLALMAQEQHFMEGLTLHTDEVLAFASAHGAAVIFEGRCTLLGDTPPEHKVLELSDWLLERGREEVFHTDRLPSLIESGDHFRALSSGLLAISLSTIHRSYLMWFRPEVIQTVHWAGDPAKPAEASENGSVRLHPRKSFETWKQIVRGCSANWLPAEIDTAGELRNAIIGIVLRKAEELAELSAELQRSNKELEAFSYSVSHDLRAPFRHIVGYSELLREHLGTSLDEKALRYIDTVIESAHSAGALVDHLLNFSRIGRARLYLSTVDMNQLLEEAVRELELDQNDRKVEWVLHDLPVVKADLSMLRVALYNLLSNALKYTRSREVARIEVGVETNEREHVFHVRDNGVGFDQKYVDKLFGVFQRLHRMEDYEGSGIGLANVRRIMARHGGRTWAEGVLDKGATFYFTLNKRTPEAI